MTGIHDIKIVHLLVSPAHAYEGRPTDGPLAVATHDRDEVEVVAGKGIVGDRFFAQRAHSNAAMTLMALEGLEQVALTLGWTRRPDPLLARRNVVLRGFDVATLRGTEFSIVGAGGEVRFRGNRAASPCAWMDVVYGPGAFKALRGKGGLRVSPLSSGQLVRGPATLTVHPPTDGEDADPGPRP